MNNPKAYSITVGNDTVGIVCVANDCNWYIAENDALRKFGFLAGTEYDSYYPNAETYIQHIHNKYGMGASAGLYGTHQFDDKKLSHRRIRLHDAYAYFNSHSKMLLIFPTVDQIKEAFAYKKLIPSANFWFCSDWKEGG